MEALIMGQDLVATRSIQGKNSGDNLNKFHLLFKDFFQKLSFGNSVSQCSDKSSLYSESDSVES